MKTGNIIDPSLMNIPAVPDFGLLRTIKIVTALPAILESNTQYIVGDTALIDITGLNGNDAKLWQVVINGVAAGAATSDLRFIMRFNAINTVGAYTSFTAQSQQGGTIVNYTANNEFFIGVVPVVNTSANVHFSSNVTISPMVVNANVFRTLQGVGSYSRSTAYYGNTTSSGTFRDATTNITSIQLTTNNTLFGIFKPGTEIQILQLDK